MRQVTKKGLISVAAAGGVLALSGGAAHAYSGADGSAQGSPGVLSGNNVQAPVNVPVNVCGNTVNGIGLLNPAMGNNCVNKGGGHHGGHQGGGHDNDHQGGGHGGGHHGGADADGEAVGSPGVGSGNNVQAPVDVPVNACGNSVTVVGALNPAIGNSCGNTGDVPAPPAPHEPEHPGSEEPDEEQPTEEKPGEEKPEEEKPEEDSTGTRDEEKPEDSSVEAVSEVAPQGELAQTGGGSMLGTAVPAGAALMLGGYVLYRRSRAAQH